VTFAPLASDARRIRGWLAAFRISAAITGVFLVLLVVMMVTRYGFGSDLSWTPSGGFGLLPKEIIEAEAGINLSTIILIVHGWLYVVYLVIDFALWRLARYGFGYFCFVALGGIIPFLSFFFEWRVPRDIKAIIASLAPPTPEDVRA